jgi:iron-sulfur cluster insertion protein
MEDVLEQPQLVKMAPGAIAKIKELIAEENNPNLKLRMFVSGGGCSGMQYGFTFEESSNEDDFDLEFEGIHVLVDSMSSQYLHGAEVDYTESLQGSQFSIKNPNAQTTCGCGSSFNPG